MANENINWRDEIKKLGKSAFELREMERLGFWPPSEEARLKTQDAREEWQRVQEELAPLRKRERELQKTISEAGDVAALLDEARRTRIERVKREREERKVRRAAEATERAEKDKAWRCETLPHLGREVSLGLRYEGGDDEKLRVSNLPVFHSASEISAALAISPRRLAWLCYHRGATSIDHYRRWSVPKKRGGTRNLASPKPALRAAQDWILQNILAHVEVHEAAAAFRPNLHIGHNAARHAHAPNGPAVVIRLDLQDFFPSVTFVRVKRGFVSLGYNEGVASIFALLCTEAPRVGLALDGKTHHVALSQRSVPQGAPTSPALTNLLCRRLDARLTGIAAHFGFVYSRYADDLVFSSADEKANAPAMQNGALKVVEESGFVANDQKTAVLRSHRRQSVTGLVVNGANGDAAPRLSRRDLRNFRAFLHGYQTRGREAMTEQIGKDSLAYAQGYLSFIHMVNAEQEAKIRRDFPWLAAWHERA
ncbi:MAG TPA: reverse transcriptase family protein [Abditibacteriaceae bacterium]|jgi:hypothetical protein